MILIIIGAPRSGTNMLRDILSSFQGISTWPCDEINYIWRYGNATYPSDEIPISRITPKIKKYIKDQFLYIIKNYNANIVVEKTCANSLRVPFVNKIFPEAKFIFIYRDGIDVVGSAKKRWTAKLDIPYLYQKVKFIPKLDMFYYALIYLFSRIFRFFSTEKRLAFWGPKLKNMNELLKKHDLIEICALQWKACIEKSEKSLITIPNDKVIRIRYENFVCHPFKELSRILKFIDKPQPKEEINNAIKNVSQISIGKGRESLNKEQIKRIKLLIGGTLKNYGYF